jgi:hypothetical protein
MTPVELYAPPSPPGARHDITPETGCCDIPPPPPLHVIKLSNVVTPPGLEATPETEAVVPVPAEPMMIEYDTGKLEIKAFT